jgi:tRNA wybutosine-synthesizing protein 3
MTFENEKKLALEKAFSNDKSKKGSIDIQILPVINLINKHPDYYTTSSCAGRIMLFKEGKTGKKNESEWLFMSHDPVKKKDIIAQIDKLAKLPQETVWFRMEAPILHICAKDMDCADSLLKIANDSGFRRSSILTFRKRIIIEIMIPERLDTPVIENKEILISKDYMNILVRHANLRLKKTRNKLKKFEKSFKLLFQ